MQKVPTPFPAVESTGFDQEARSTCFRAELRCAGTSKSGSLAMSETMTGDLRYAAVPQEPAQGPIGRFSICCAHSLGRLGPAMQSRWTPSAFSNKTEASVPVRCSSIIRHNVFRISFSPTPVAIISRSRFSPASKASLFLRSLMSRRIAWKYPPRNAIYRYCGAVFRLLASFVLPRFARQHVRKHGTYNLAVLGKEQEFKNICSA